MKKNLAELHIIKIIHIEKEIDLVNSMNPDPNFYGWRFYDYKNHKISESFNSSLFARKQLIDGKVIWRRMGMSKPSLGDKDHSIKTCSPPTDEELL